MAELRFLIVAQRQMVEIADMFPKQPAEITDTILSVQGLTLAGIFHDISFDLRRGKSLGLAGLAGIVAAAVADIYRQRASGKGA